MRGARLAALLALVATMAAAAERVDNPIQAFVEGYDPSGSDFLANVPERTVLLRVRADLDGDGRPDLAVSDSSTWGNAGGQWLLFHGQPDGAYTYWGTLFFAPGTAHANTIRERNANACAVLRRRAHACSCSRSASLNLICAFGRPAIVPSLSRLTLT